MFAMISCLVLIIKYIKVPILENHFLKHYNDKIYAMAQHRLL